MSDKINLDDFSKFLAEKVSHIDEKLEIKIKLCCQKVSDDIKYSMDHTERNNDISYFINNKNIAHHPSLPGNPPAVDTGRLKGSINYETHNEGREVYGIVGSMGGVEYAEWMEYGTSKIKPRPWLKPAMYKNADFIRKHIAQAVANTFTGGNS